MMKYKLTNNDINSATECLKVHLESVGMNRKDQIRTIFAVEEALLIYQSEFGQEVTFTLDLKKRFGKEGFSLTIEKVDSFNPFDADEDKSTLFANNFLGMYDLLPKWKFIKGKNTIILVIPKKSMNSGMKMSIALLLAGACYFIATMFPQNVADSLAQYIIYPALSTLYGILTALSGPIIFCFLVSGICSMGDISSFEVVGKKVVQSFILATMLYAVFTGVWFLFYYVPVGVSGMGGVSGFVEIYQMILAFIPGNILSPIVDNQPIQIITLGICTGIILLILQKSTPQLLTIVQQINEVLFYALKVVSSNIHIMVFFSVLQALLSGNISMFFETFELAIMFIVGLVILSLIIIIRTCIKVKISPIKIIKKCKSTFLIALTTASSTAAFADNVEVCKNKLGIDEKIVNFGIPFGQVVFMPFFSMMNIVIALYMLSAYDLPITYTTVFVAFLLAIVLSLALPPIPGGALTVVSILFAQLGIPETALATITIFLVLTDFPATGGNIVAVQTEMLIVANEMNMLDRDILSQN